MCLARLVLGRVSVEVTVCNVSVIFETPCILVQCRVRVVGASGHVTSAAATTLSRWTSHVQFVVQREESSVSP